MSNNESRDALSRAPRTEVAGAVAMACPTCGGSQTTWKCTCEPMWEGYTPISADAAAAPADERAAFEQWWNDNTTWPVTSKNIALHAWQARAAASQPAAAAGQEEPVPYGYEFLDMAGKNHFVRGSLPDYAQSEIVALYTAPPAQVATRQGLTDEQILDEFVRKGFNVYDLDGVAIRPLGRAAIEVVGALLAAQQPEPRAEVTDEHPSLTNPLTPYGMLVRALRIVAQTSLYDIGQALLLSPAKLSAMEFGREPVTPEIVREVGTYFESLGIHNMRPALQFAADGAGTDSWVELCMMPRSR